MKCYDLDNIEAVVSGAINVKPVLADNCSVANIPASLTEVLLIASNTLRREVVIHNNSNGILYVLCGSGVTSTNYSYKLDRGDVAILDTYRGAYYGIFTNAIGFSMVTEKYY